MYYSGTLRKDIRLKTFQQQLAEAIDGRTIPAPSVPAPAFIDYPFEQKELSEADRRLLILLREFGAKRNG